MDGISIALYWFTGLCTNYRANGPKPYSNLKMSCTNCKSSH